MGYFYVALTVILTVFGQLVLKWQVSLAGALPEAAGDRAVFLAMLLVRPWVIGGFAAAFLASIAWMGAMTKFDLSYAYPFMSLNFVIVAFLSVWLFGEPFSAQKGVGLGLVVLGIVIGGR